MRKLLRVIIICTAILLLMIAQTFAVYAASTVIYVTADKTEAEPGDTVNFTVSMGPVSDMGSMQMKLDIPDGLTYVKGSGALAGGLQKELGFDMLDFTESSLIINGVASTADYSSKSDTEICTFSCTVNDGFKGKAEVSLTNLDFGSCKTWEDHTADYSVSKAVISVGQDAAQGGPADPGKASDPSGSSASQSQSDNAQTEDQAGDGTSEANGSTQGNGTEDQSADEAKTETTGEAAGNAAAERAEEEHSSATIWLIALAAVLLIAVAIAVVFKKRKRQ